MSLVSQNRGRLLSDEHPITQHVRKVVSAILEANGLGTIEGSAAPDDAVARSHLPGFKDSRRRWRLAVIDNDRMVNSTASSGKSNYYWIFDPMD